MDLRKDASYIIEHALNASLPDAVVEKTLAELPVCSGRLYVVSVGKAAWRMAHAAHRCLGSRIHTGIVITKYGHSQGSIPGFSICEAGHPVPDDNTFAATEAALELVRELNESDLVLFLLSGGGSALFEKPLVSPNELVDITRQLLKCGAEIKEINTIRKRLSAVKGGRFALACAPAKVFSIVLSDVLGDAPDMIASGPTCVDSSTADDAVRIAGKYDLRLSDTARSLLSKETPKSLPNAVIHVSGSVRQLCAAGMKACEDLGYHPILLTTELCCQAREAGSFMGSIAAHHCSAHRSVAFLAGGETVVHVTGDGLGGRNQELVLAAARQIDGIEHVAVFSFGSDGTDGPTDAAGGFVDGSTLSRLKEAGLEPEEVLGRNDAYHALQAVDGLIVTGPTGTNVNDLSVVLIRRSY